MKKVLYVATVVKTHIMQFHIPFLKMCKEMGWETSVAARNDYYDRSECVIPYCDKYYDVPFERSPFKSSNIKAYKKLKKIIEIGDYDIIHCHTPVGGVICRLASRSARKKGTKVIYTAHGFHFFKGAPIKNWILYYPVEKFCSRFTEVLITINHEDYELAQKKMHAKKIVYIPGVGIDVDKFAQVQVDRAAKKRELGVPEDAFLVLSVGELNKNKNHSIVIEAIARINNDQIHYAIAGQGESRQELESLAERLGIEYRVHLLGYRNDVAELYKAADLFCFPSLREGLGMVVLEAMACGLPVICSTTRGSVDIIENNVNGILADNSVDTFVTAIERLVLDENIRFKLAENAQIALDRFKIDSILGSLKILYLTGD